MNFTVDEVRELAVIHVDDFTIKRRIQKDKHGHRFFYVPNLLNAPSRSRVNQLFGGRIKDAVETIRNGNGDVLQVSNFLATEEVLYFLDREYGEMMREKFLKGWQNAVFAYAIKYRGYRELDIDDNYHFPATPTKYFESEKEAQDYLDQLIQVAKKDAKLYNSLSEDEQRCFFNENFSDAREALLIWQFEKEENPNVPPQLRVVQTIRK